MHGTEVSSSCPYDQLTFFAYLGLALNSISDMAMSRLATVNPTVQSHNWKNPLFIKRKQNRLTFILSSSIRLLMLHAVWAASGVDCATP